MSKSHRGKKKSVNPKSAEQTFSGDRSLERALIGVIKYMTFFALFTPLIVVSDFLFPFVGPKSIIFMGAIQIIAAAYIVLIIYYSRYRPKFNILTITLLIYLGVLVLTTLTGISPLRSFWSNHERMTGLLMWFHLTAFFVVLSSVFKTHREWRDIFAVTISVAAIVGAISLLEIIGLLDFPGARGGSTIGNTSFMGVYLLFNAFIAIYLFLKSQNAIRYYSLAIFLLIVAALFVSDALASIIAFVGGIALLLLLYLSFMTGKRYLKILGLAVISVSVVAIAVLGFLLFEYGSVVREQFIRVDTEARLTAWAVSWRGFTERPWLGWGPENFTIPFMEHFDPRLFLPEHGGEVLFDRAHNIILDTLMASGIVGLLSYIAIFAAAFILLWKPFFKGKGEFWIAGIFSVTFIAYFVQNLSVFDMINSYMMFILLLGFAAALPIDEEIEHSKKLRKKTAPLHFVAVITVFLGVFYVFTVSPWSAGSYAARSQRPQDITELLHFYGRSIDSSPLGRDKTRLFLADQFMAFAATEEGAQADRNAMERVFRFLENELQINTRQYPHDFKVHIDLARFYNSWARLDLSKAYRARSVLDKAIELSPKNQMNYWTLAETLVLLNEHDEAVKAAEKAVELEPRLLQSHEMLVRVAAAFGDTELAEEKLRRAIEINPGWEAHLRTFIPPIQ